MSFVPGWMPGASIVKPTTVEFGSINSNSSNPINTVTRTAQGLGTVANNRRICAVIWSQNNGIVSDTNAVTAVSVSEVGLTKLFQYPGSASNSPANITVWLSDTLQNGGPSGATAQIDVTRNISGGFFQVSWGIFGIYNMKSSTIQSFIPPGVVGSLTPVSGNLSLINKGVAVGICTMVSGGPASVLSWTGMTLQAQAPAYVIGGGRISAALLSNTPFNSSLPVSVSAVTGSNFLELAAFTFR